MSALFGVFRYEFLMGAQRRPVWLATVLISLPAITALSPTAVASASVWTSAAIAALMLNMLGPVVAGIAISDRLVRDQTLGVGDLLRTTPLARQTYVLGKYFGAVAGALAPILAISLLMAATFVVLGAAPALFAAQLAAFACINVPTYLFIGAFSLACPTLLPLRVYQVLFTGYWFWANYLSARVVPTLAGTIFTPYGIYAASGIVGSADRINWWPVYSLGEGLANVGLLLSLSAVAIAALDRVIARREAAM